MAGCSGSLGRCAAAAALALLLAAAGPVSAAPTFEDREVAVLQALDKVTARVQQLELPVGERLEFGTLTITVRACRSTPPVEPPESAAFLEIVDARPGEAPQLAFSGWMFASSPALSALEHPVYDVWVLDCRSAVSTSSSEPR